MMDKRISLEEAVQAVASGHMLALGGMTLYRRPMAFTRQLIRRFLKTGEPRDLTLLCFTAGLESDLLVGAGMVAHTRTCYFGLEIFGLAPMFTYHANNGLVDVVEETEASLAFGLRAQMAGVGFMPGRGWLGTDLPRLRLDVQTVIDPYSGEELMAFPAIQPDVAVIHALRADPEGNAILGIALGSSQAGGYVTRAGKITGWLNELAFCPVDYSPGAPVEEWSGDRGCGALYFSQQCVFRLAPQAGIALPEGASNTEKLELAQDRLHAGHKGAIEIWQTMGVTLGYGIAHYADFYDLKHVLSLGRCTSGEGGALIVDGARRVLATEFPELAERITVQVPDEKSRRVGQSIAAASLPAILKTGRGNRAPTGRGER